MKTMNKGEGNTECEGCEARGGSAASRGGRSGGRRAAHLGNKRVYIIKINIKNTDKYIIYKKWSPRLVNERLR